MLTRVLYVFSLFCSWTNQLFKISSQILIFSPSSYKRHLVAGPAFRDLEKTLIKSPFICYLNFSKTKYQITFFRMLNTFWFAKLGAMMIVHLLFQLPRSAASLQHRPHHRRESENPWTLPPTRTTLGRRDVVRLLERDHRDAKPPRFARRHASSQLKKLRRPLQG